MGDFQFRHTLPIQLRFNDIDQFGHVNNSIYFTYYDLGKADYFARVHPDLDLGRDGVVVVNIEANFLSPILGADKVAVQTTVAEIGNKSMTLLQQVLNTETKEVKCTCKSILVAFDLKKNESRIIPEDWIEAVSAYEGRDVRKKPATN